MVSLGIFRSFVLLVINAFVSFKHDDIFLQLGGYGNPHAVKCLMCGNLLG